MKSEALGLLLDWACSQHKPCSSTQTTTRENLCEAAWQIGRRSSDHICMQGVLCQTHVTPPVILCPTNSYHPSSRYRPTFNEQKKRNEQKKKTARAKKKARTKTHGHAELKHTGTQNKNTRAGARSTQTHGRAHAVHKHTARNKKTHGHAEQKHTAGAGRTKNTRQGADNTKPHGTKQKKHTGTRQKQPWARKKNGHETTNTRHEQNTRNKNGTKTNGPKKQKRNEKNDLLNRHGTFSHVDGACRYVIRKDQPTDAVRPIRWSSAYRSDLFVKAQNWQSNWTAYFLISA